jgi:hypothetical protein
MFPGLVGFEVFTVVSTKMAVFWVLITLMMEAARTSEMLVNFYQTTQHTTQKTAIIVPSFVSLEVVCCKVTGLFIIGVLMAFCCYL